MRRIVLQLSLLAAAAWAAYSYTHDGLIAVLSASMGDTTTSLDRLRTYIQGWGALGPLVYIVAVVIEVVIVPIPGTLLYAPAGAVFGGFWGGAYSLVGNTLGAMIACLIATIFGERLAARLEGSNLRSLAERVRLRSAWLVLLLRINPFTSSDLVSYAAGLVRVPVWKVGLGTFVGMAPLCFAQSYFSEQVFRWLPGGAIMIVVLGVVYAAVIVAILLKAKGS